jgi:hypothetical protein
MFNFGGNTSAFPSLKRSGTGLIIRLADDSGDANITTSGLTVSTTPTTSVGTYDVLTRNTSTGVVEKTAYVDPSIGQWGATGKNANATLTASETSIEMANGGYTITLPSAVNGKIYVIKGAQEGSVSTVPTQIASSGSLEHQTAGVNLTVANGESLVLQSTGAGAYNIIAKYSSEYAINTTTTALSAASLNSAYPNVKPNYKVICGDITGGGVIYTKYTEAGSSDVWLTTAATITP